MNNELSSSQLFALQAPLSLPWGQAHIFSSPGVPARLNTYSRFPLGTENLLVWSQNESGFSCLNPIAFSKVATHLPNVLGLKGKALHDIPAQPIGLAWRTCSKSHFAIISEFLLRPYKAVTDLPIAMGLTNISLPISVENVIWFRLKELIIAGIFFSDKKKNQVQNKKVSNTELITFGQGLVGIWLYLSFCSLPVV